MKRRSELRRAPDEIDNMLESHYAAPYEYWRKKQEEQK